MKGLIPALICCCLLCGCAQERIVDRINIIQSIGLDKEGETIKVSASFPSYIKGAREQASPITAESNVTYGLFTALTAKSSQPIELGQMRTLVLSETFAREAIDEFAEIINRESLKSSNATIVVTKQNVNSIISDSSKKPPFYLSELIEHNMKQGNTPKTNYHSFLNQYYGAGQDLYLPVINKDKGLLHMDGICVFKGDELKLWLTAEEGLYLKLLTDKAMTGEYDFKLGPQEMYSLIILRGKRNITVAHDGETTIFLRLSIALREIPKAINVQNKADLQKVKEQIETKLSSEITTLLTRLQKNKVDPVGFGEYYRWQHRTFNEPHYYEKIYPNQVFEVKSKIIITYSGVGQ